MLRFNSLLAAVFIVIYVEAFAFSNVKMSPETTLAPFRLRKALKIISGISNFDEGMVADVAAAAERGGATHLDIAADPRLIRAARNAAPSVSICVSAINPKAFIPCVEAGVDMIELGNFDNFYDQGRNFSASDIIEMTRETRDLFKTIPLSVTIPHRLSLQDQIQLAKELEALGVDVIQTEGKATSIDYSESIQKSIECSAPALAATYALSRVTNIPIMAASGICEITLPMAFSIGASGVGVGSAVNKLKSQAEMTRAVAALATVMGLPLRSVELSGGAVRNVVA